jgi:hypothetical protein
MKRKAITVTSGMFDTAVVEVAYLNTVSQAVAVIDDALRRSKLYVKPCRGEFESGLRSCNERNRVETSKLSFGLLAKRELPTRQ